MKIRILAILALALTIYSCQSDDTDAPISAETQQLRAQYNDLVVGDWYFASKSEHPDSARIFEHLHFFHDGKVTGEIRVGYIDSTEVTIQNMVTTKDGTSVVSSTTHNFRYITNDTVSGTWSLENHVPDANYITILYNQAAQKINQQRYNTYNQAITLNSPSIRFYYCNANSLILNNADEKMVTFTHVPAVPNF